MPSTPSVAADDMFSGVDRAPAPAPVTPPAAARVVPPLPESSHPPILHYILIALAVVVVLGVIAGTVWFFAIRRPTRQVMETLPAAPAETVSVPNSTPPSAPPADEPLNTDVFSTEPEAIPSKPVIAPPEGSNVPPPTSIDLTPSTAPVVAVDVMVATTSTDDTSQTTPSLTADQDADGLSDVRETELGTSVSLSDTDGDGLSDGDEVSLYRTNPLVPDTDGDTYPDGVEVQKGYNPLGPGTCANPTCTM